MPTSNKMLTALTHLVIRGKTQFRIISSSYSKNVFAFTIYCVCVCLFLGNTDNKFRLKFNHSLSAIT